MNSGNDGSSKDTSDGWWSKQETGCMWGSKNKDCWSNHLLERGLSGNSDAALVVWLELLNYVFGVWSLLLSLSSQVVLSGFVVLDDDCHHLNG